LTTINQELYRALLTANVPEDQATAAARAVPDIGLLATREDMGLLRVEMAELKTELLYWMVGGFMAQTAVLLSVLGLLLR